MAVEAVEDILTAVEAMVAATRAELRSGAAVEAVGGTAAPGMATQSSQPRRARHGVPLS